MIKFKRVIVGISGGVDSAVTALLLKNKGYDVQGVFMQNWDIADEEGQCSASQDFKDASIVCDQLGIKLHYVNFVKHYWNHVFSNLLKEYENGYTPNPDILCNKYIKFDRFIAYAREHLNADAVATGHYANTSFGPYLENYAPNKKVKLLKAYCTHKDQTFFLSQISQESLQRFMFPLGPLLKCHVKEIALQNKLYNVLNRRESTGICFIGKRNFQNFISEYIDDKPGYFIDIDTNEIKGTHNGIHQWTIGQKSRLSNYNFSNYIARKDPLTNNIYLAEGYRHFSFYTDLLVTSEVHWIHSEPPEFANGDVVRCEFKFQHVEALEKCWVFKTPKGFVISIDKPMRCITAGQYAVFYRDHECLGSGRITHPGICHYFLNKYTNRSNKFMPKKAAENVIQETTTRVKELNEPTKKDEDRSKIESLNNEIVDKISYVQ